MGFMMMIASAHSQSNLNPFLESENKNAEPFQAPSAYIGFSTGINNMIGVLGPQLDIVLNKNLTLGAGIGLSTWGTKWALNMKFYPKGWYQFYVKGGYSKNSGLVDFETELELASGRTEKVLMDLEPMGNVFFAAGYAWKIGKRHKFFVEAGYAVPIETDDYYELHDDSLELSGTSETVMQMLQPGGLVISLGLSFAM